MNFIFFENISTYNRKANDNELLSQNNEIIGNLKLDLLIKYVPSD